jgi:lambda repressor-like predicted transcriptional regulator
MHYIIDREKLKKIMKSQGVRSFAALSARLGKSRQALLDAVLKDNYNIIKTPVQDIADILDVDPLEIIRKK